MERVKTISTSTNDKRSTELDNLKTSLKLVRGLRTLADTHGRRSSAAAASSVWTSLEEELQAELVAKELCTDIAEEWCNILAEHNCVSNVESAKKCFKTLAEWSTSRRGKVELHRTNERAVAARADIDPRQ